MGNTYTQIYIQLVFAVKYREAFIKNSFKDELHRYITGIFKNNKQKLLAINSMPDHIHIFFGMKPVISLSEFVRDVKSDSSLFVNEKKFINHKFHWQEGYGGFSYGQSQIDSVIKYVMNQENHHMKRTFREEYITFLKKFKLEYSEEFLFRFFD